MTELRRDLKRGSAPSLSLPSSRSNAAPESVFSSQRASFFSLARTRSLCFGTVRQLERIERLELLERNPKSSRSSDPTRQSGLNFRKQFSGNDLIGAQRLNDLNDLNTLSLDPTKG